MQANTVTLSGIIASIEPIRHTPAGLPLVRFQLHHGSTQIEAGLPRKVECTVGCVGIGGIATALARYQAGAVIQVTGFLSQRGRGGTQNTLHITTIA